MVFTQNCLGCRQTDTNMLVDEDGIKFTFKWMGKDMTSYTKTKRKKVLYFSRGRGFGHAIGDIEVIRELKKRDENLDISIVSYAHGYEAFAKHGFTEIENLYLDYENEFFSPQGLLRTQQLIKSVRPDLIVANEMFNVLPLAREHGLPAVLITHWFFEAVHSKPTILSLFMACANHIIFGDLEDFHEKPPKLKAPVSFVGPIMRKIVVDIQDRNVLKKELGFQKTDKVILVSFGGAFEKVDDGLEKGKIVLKKIYQAFNQLNIQNLKLILLVGQIYDYATSKFDNPNVTILRESWDFDKLMAASNIAIVRGSYRTLCELAVIGTPAICIPFLKGNPVDEMHIRNFERLGTLKTLEMEELTLESLMEKIQEILELKDKSEKMAKASRKLKQQCGYKTTAQIILDHLNS